MCRFARLAMAGESGHHCDMVKIDWASVEEGTEANPRLLDFYVTDRTEIDRILTLPARNLERAQMMETALEEIIRCYSAYKVASGLKPFGIGVTGKHRAMRESGLVAAETMLDKGIGPADVLYRLAQPGGMAWISAPLQCVPWALLCSVKIIDMTARRTMKASKNVAGATKKAPVTHSYSRPHDRADESLRSRLEAKFGKAAVAAIAKDDGELFIKVEARAREFKKNARLYLPASSAEMVRWYAKEHVE